MDSINQWLDPSEVRHLAERLLRPVSPARLSSTHPGFDSSFVGFTPNDAKPTEQQLVTSTAPAPLPPIASPSPSFSATAAPSPSRVQERMEIFRNWLSENFQATEVFLLDHEGKVIFDEGGHGRFHFMARNLALASQGSGNIRIKIGPATMLEIIPCEAPHGRIVLGALFPTALPADHIDTITELLAQTAAPA